MRESWSLNQSFTAKMSIKIVLRTSSPTWRSSLSLETSAQTRSPLLSTGWRAEESQLLQR